MPTERPARSLLGLLAGLALFDMLVNLPGLDRALPLGSLLLPSVDLLILAAACMGIAHADAHARLPLRIGLGALGLVLVGCGVGLRFGFDAGASLFGDGSLQRLAGWTISGLLIAAAGGAAFLISGLLISGLQPPVSRSVFLLVVSLAVVLQVVSGKRLFSGSVIPRLVALAGSQAR